MNSDIQVLARTIYGEARGEYTHPEGGLSSLIAIGNVVMNRLLQQTWFGKTIIEVCQKPWQFSCWNSQDPNYSILMQGVICDPIYQICYQVADNIISGIWPDITEGCDHYHSVTVKPPKWAQNVQPKIKIGRHKFYDLRRKA